MRADASSVGRIQRWGVVSGPAVWPAVVRILFVIDGRVDTSACQTAFGLGYVLETLRDPSFAWWVRFRVQVVRRDAKSLSGECADAPDVNYNQPGEPPPAFATCNFRFTDDRFQIDDWDQIWFFGDYPGNQFPAPGETVLPIDDPSFSPLLDDELCLLAEWMDRGGGVFAAGDHWDLGASLCSRIPRVRTMRKWTPAQGVPTMDGDRRNQTLQPGASGNPDVQEGDTFPQPIEPVYWSRVASYLDRPLWAHPLLSTTTGVIDHFPDHMHEGEVFADDAVELDKPLNIVGYNGVEYPELKPEVLAAAAALGVGAGVVVPRVRPRPHVVAYGRTTNIKDVITPPLGGVEVAAFVRPGLSTVRFPLIGAYDGDRVGRGRVVVDSTWHHWFTYNLHGFRSDPDPLDRQYELMQSYFRNVALWLAGLKQRQSMLVAAVWGAVVSDPMAFPATPQRSVWSVGKRAVEVIGRTLSPSLLFDFVASQFNGGADAMFDVSAQLNPADPYTDAVPADLAIRAIVGGLASSLIQPATDYLQATGKSRRVLDPAAIAKHAEEGLRAGNVALIDATQSVAVDFNNMAARLESAFQPARPQTLPVETIGVRVVAERLQLPTPTDPVLVDGTITFTTRLSFAGTVAAVETFAKLRVPDFEPRGAVVALDRVVYEGFVQSGERPTLEVITGEHHLGTIEPESVMFTDTLEGEPSSWIGRHAPSRHQRWRLWYRIEATDEQNPEQAA